ncbi:hypothetical protein DER45DRAFT_306902 [Fusarium avenaceum]|nr:hypothetical protein DER45DRAFT_306902 [Fusarium avenaceum]
MLTTIPDKGTPLFTSHKFGNGVPLSDYTDTQSDHPAIISVAGQYQTLFGIADTILSLFLPTSGSSSAHPICRHFWGTIDAILRQIYFSLVSPQHFTRTACVTVSPLLSPIRSGSFGSSSVQLPSGECTSCNEYLQYPSVYEALGHIHQHHLQCTCSFEGSKIVDHPCAGWLQWYGLESDPDEPLISTVVIFIDALNGIRDKARDIHSSVTGSSENSNATDSRPHLLRNLVYCFEDIMGKLLLTAKELSWMNRTRLRHTGPDPDIPTPSPLSAIRDRCKRLDGTLEEHFNLAKRDVMVLGTSRGNIDRPIISPVGSEFLLAMLLSNLQNNTILQGTSQKMDIIKHYRKVSTGLRFGAMRSPKRQRFLEISALEEELDAICAILEVQGRMIEAYRTILDPESFITGTADWAYIQDRKAMYPLEKTHLDSQVRKLSEGSTALEVLKQIAQSTRHDMKQIIEVLEEGHGKAIRVFTFVTLFFLPLSFVTSFFGMNTTDIRDTNWDQRIFWLSAVPVTALVLALALIYGYKLDEVRDLFMSTFTQQRSPRLHDISEQDVTPLMREPDDGNDKLSHVRSTTSQRVPWISGLARVKKQRQSGKNEQDVPRRQTFDSLLA